MPPSIDALIQSLQSVGYYADRRLATAAYLALKLQRPLLVEGEPGVGKTELAKALVALDTLALDPEVVTDTAGILFKQREDVAALTPALAGEVLAAGTDTGGPE